MTDDTEAIGEAIRAATARVQAPDSLRERLATASLPTRRRRRLVPALAGAGAVGVATVVLAIAGGGTSGPGLDDAVAAALHPAAGPPPAAHGSGELATRLDTIRFPRWERAFGLRAAGRRAEELEGRRAMTVTYGGPRGGVGYTIVASPPLGVPEGARRVGDFAVLERDGASVVTWRRDGHTCVLASRSLGAERLLQLAASTAAGGGSPPY